MKKNNNDNNVISPETPKYNYFSVTIINLIKVDQLLCIVVKDPLAMSPKTRVAYRSVVGGRYHCQQ